MLVVGIPRWKKEAKKRLERQILNPILRVSEIEWPENRKLEQYYHAFICDLWYQIYMDTLEYQRTTKDDWYMFMIRRCSDGGTNNVLTHYLKGSNHKIIHASKHTPPTQEQLMNLLPNFQHHKQLWTEYFAQSFWSFELKYSIFVDYIIQLEQCHTIDDVLKLDAASSLVSQFTVS